MKCSCLRRPHFSSLKSFDGISNLLSSSVLSLPLSFRLPLTALNVDEVDELIKSIAVGGETERDIKIQRQSSEKESHRGRGEQRTDGRTVAVCKKKKDEEKLLLQPTVLSCGWTLWRDSTRETSTNIKDMLQKMNKAGSVSIIPFSYHAVTQKTFYTCCKCDTSFINCISSVPHTWSNSPLFNGYSSFLFVFT